MLLPSYRQALVACGTLPHKHQLVHKHKLPDIALIPKEKRRSLKDTVSTTQKNFFFFVAVVAAVLVPLETFETKLRHNKQAKHKHKQNGRIRETKNNVVCICFVVQAGIEKESRCHHDGFEEKRNCGTVRSYRRWKWRSRSRCQYYR